MSWITEVNIADLQARVAILEKEKYETRKRVLAIANGLAKEDRERLRNAVTKPYHDPRKPKFYNAERINYGDALPPLSGGNEEYIL